MDCSGHWITPLIYTEYHNTGLHAWTNKNNPIHLFFHFLLLTGGGESFTTTKFPLTLIFHVTFFLNAQFTSCPLWKRPLASWLGMGCFSVFFLPILSPKALTHREARNEEPGHGPESFYASSGIKFTIKNMKRGKEKCPSNDLHTSNYLCAHIQLAASWPQWHQLRL